MSFLGSIAPVGTARMHSRAGLRSSSRRCNGIILWPAPPVWFDRVAVSSVSIWCFSCAGSEGFTGGGCLAFFKFASFVFAVCPSFIITLHRRPLPGCLSLFEDLQAPQELFFEFST